jgi:hypothetical protein
MKKTPFLRLVISTLCLLTACLTTASAQQRFSAGPRIGLNYSTLAVNTEPTPGAGAVNVKFRPGLVAGAFLMYSSLNHFGLSIDALYSQRNSQLSLSNLPIYGGAVASYAQRINYLEIPIALRYFLNRGGDFRPNLFFGPSLAFRLKAKTDNHKINDTDVPTLARDITSEVEPLDLGLMAGFQLNFPGFFGERQRFLIDGRYTYGLTKINKLGTNNLHNSTITLTLGYGFGVGPEFRSRYRKR